MKFTSARNHWESMWASIFVLFVCWTVPLALVTTWFTSATRCTTISQGHFRLYIWYQDIHCNGVHLCNGYPSVQVGKQISGWCTTIESIMPRCYLLHNKLTSFIRFSNWIHCCNLWSNFSNRRSKIWSNSEDSVSVSAIFLPLDDVMK